MELIISNKEAIEKIVETFAKKPKTPIDCIRIYSSCKNDVSEIAYVDFEVIGQRRHSKYECCIGMRIENRATTIIFYNCSTGKKAEFEL